MIVTLEDMKNLRTRNLASHKAQPNQRLYDLVFWRNKILIDQLEQLGAGAKIHLITWEILSDNEAFFNFNEENFATTIHKLYLPTCTFWCNETSDTLFTGCDILQTNVAADGEPEQMVDLLPFYHSLENCSESDTQCLGLPSCYKHELNSAFLARQRSSVLPRSYPNFMRMLVPSTGVNATVPVVKVAPVRPPPPVLTNFANAANRANASNGANGTIAWNVANGNAANGANAVNGANSVNGSHAANGANGSNGASDESNEVDSWDESSDSDDDNMPNVANGANAANATNRAIAANGANAANAENGANAANGSNGANDESNEVDSWDESTDSDDQMPALGM